jgi:hypothetical protein
MFNAVRAVDEELVGLMKSVNIYCVPERLNGDVYTG